MDFAKHFPASTWVFRTLTGRWARRVYLAALILLLSMPVISRARNAYRAREFKAVLSGLEKVKIDQTTEAELLGLVPRLTRSQPYKDSNQAVEAFYWVEFSNSHDLWRAWAWSRLYDYYHRDLERVEKAAPLLGAGFLGFGAGVSVRNGKVSNIGYRVGTLWPGMSDLLFVRSVHGRWQKSPSPFWVRSVDDQNLRFRVSVFPPKENVTVEWSPDAPAELLSHLYQLDLSCVWSLHGCIDGREIAPQLWRDAERIKAAARERLTGSDPCPDRILADRIRYFPDADVLWLEAVKSQEKEGTSEGEVPHEVDTDYKLLEVIRGISHSSGNIHIEDFTTIPSPYGGILKNPISPHRMPGERVLFFSNPYFESCRIVPATRSALAAVRTAPAVRKFPEDEYFRGL